MAAPQKRVARVEEMMCIVDIIKYHFALRGVSTMFLVKLTEFIHGANHTYIMSKDEILRLIERLAEFCPEWIKIVDNEAGRLVKINKEIPIFNVFKQLKAL